MFVFEGKEKENKLVVVPKKGCFFTRNGNECLKNPFHDDIERKTGLGDYLIN